MTKRYIADTNVFLNCIEVIEKYPIVVTSSILRELEKIESNSDKYGLRSFQAREARRKIKAHKDKIHIDLKDYVCQFDDYDKDYEDNKILQCAIDNNFGIITLDGLLAEKAQLHGVEWLDVEKDSVDEEISKYTGIRDLLVDEGVESQLALAHIYQHSKSNQFEMVENEYLVIWDKNKPTYHRVTGEINGFESIDTFRFDGEKLVKLKFKQTEDLFMGKTKPINVKQQLAFDMLQNKNVGVNLVLGGAGSGKDHLMAAHMMQALQREEIDKIVFVRNIQKLKDSGEVGFLKGDLFSKMATWSLPLADQIGGLEALEMLMEKGKIEIQHFESIRGRSFNRCGVYVTEIQSMSDYHARVLLSRIGKDSFIYMNGDIKQTDSDYNKHNSAINTLKKLKGNPLFGVVTLDKTERSDISSLSELI
jgi:PhoH-like ATPase